MRVHGNAWMLANRCPEAWNALRLRAPQQQPHTNALVGEVQGIVEGNVSRTDDGQGPTPGLAALQGRHFLDGVEQLFAGQGFFPWNPQWPGRRARGKDEGTRP